MTVTLPDGWQSWPPEAKRRLLALVGQQNWHDVWRECARPNQTTPPGDWPSWLLMAGRGFGKTRTGAEWAWRMAHDNPGSYGALVSVTAADVRDTMVEGESGILSCVPDWFRPKYEPSKRRLTYPNGSLQTTFSGEEPDRLRGPQHHYAWVDEWAAMPKGEELMTMLDLGLRLGQLPRKLITTTPRPHPWLRDLVNENGTVVTSGSTYENLDNLAPNFRKRILAKYEGTRMGRQELLAELLTEIEGALWSMALIDAARLRGDEPEPPPLGRTVVAIDPALTAGEDSDETGIIVAATVLGSDPTEFVVLDDLSGRYTPNAWATAAARAAEKYGADAIVAETNAGGDMVASTLAAAAPWARYKPVHAGKSKKVRAEPVAALYEQGRVHHLGTLPVLEDQMVTWVPDGKAKSPDRLDALVWAVTDLARREIAPVRRLRS